MIDRAAIAGLAAWATAQDLEALAQGVSDAGRDWPDVEVALDPFLAQVRARWEASADAGRSAARVKDLLFAFACARGDAAALRRFDAVALGQAAAAIRRMGRGEDFVDEALQRAREHLLVGGEKGPRIAGYGGVGNLPGWARVVAVRLALRMRSAGLRPQPIGSPLRVEPSGLRATSCWWGRILRPHVGALRLPHLGGFAAGRPWRAGANFRAPQHEVRLQ